MKRGHHVLALEKKGEKLSVALQCVSLGAFAGLLLFFSDSASPLAILFNTDAALQYFFVSALCAGACCGFLFILRGVLSGSVDHRYLEAKSGAVSLIGLTACLVVSYLGLSETVFILTGAVFGLGFGALGIGKGARLCEMDEQRFLRVAAFASLIASLVKILLLTALFQWVLAAAILLLTALSFVSSIVNTSQAITTNQDVSPIEMAKGMVERNWVLFCGLLLCLSVNELAWSGILSEHIVSRAPGLDGRVGTAVGSFAASFVLLFATKRRLLSRLRVIALIIPMLCITIILLTWYVGVWHDGLNLFGGYDTSWGEFVTSTPIGFSITLIAVILMWRLGNEVRFGLSPAFALGLFLALTSSFFLLSTVSQSLLSWTVLNSIDSMSKIIYLVVAAIYMILLTQRKTRDPVPLLDERIQEVSARFGLSKRETEILALLVQGRSAPYIADAEFIALSTVKTHMKHLYSKTSVHNREDLLNLVYKQNEK
jgi:DNA-binding CsgD family transcriptional regulator